MATLVALSLLVAACGQTDNEVALTLPTSGASPAATGQATVGAGLASTASATASSVTSVSPAAEGAPTATPAIFATAAATTRAATTRAASSTVATTSPPSVTAAPKATLAPPKPLTGFAGKLSLIGPDETLYIARFDGSNPQLVLGKPGLRPSKTQDGAVHRWPTWTRDGSKLAVISSNVKAGAIVNSDVTVVGADGKNPVKVQDGSAEQPVFISWSPDGNLLSLLVSGSSQLELRLLDTSKGLQSAPATLRKIAEGGAIYTGWSPDSQQLLIHATSSASSDTVALLAAKDNKAQAVPLKIQPGAFRSPAFSNDGSRLAFSVAGSGNEEVTVQDKNGQSLGGLDAGGKGASFNWSPVGNKLAYSSQLTSMQGFYKGISLADFDTAGNPKPAGTVLVNEPVAAFFWSPSGKKIAYIGITDNQDLLTWKIYDTDTKTATLLTQFYPSNTFIQFMTYYDQYGQANSIWSPDSKALVFSGYSKDDVDRLTNPNAQGADDTPFIYILPTEGVQSGKLTPMALGQMAFWSK